MNGQVYFVIAQKNFRDEELLEPLELLKSEGLTTVILSQKKGTCTGSGGTSVESDFAIAKAPFTDDLKAVIVVGGSGSPSLQQEKSLGDLLQKAKEKGLLIGAICLGPMVVASFGVIEGMTATVFPTEESLALLKQKKVDYLNEDVVVDDFLVTANGAHAASAFAHNIIDNLQPVKLN